MHNIGKWDSKHGAEDTWSRKPPLASFVAEGCSVFNGYWSGGCLTCQSGVYTGSTASHLFAHAKTWHKRNVKQKTCSNLTRFRGCGCGRGGRR